MSTPRVVRIPARPGPRTAPTSRPSVPPEAAEGSRQGALSGENRFGRQRADRTFALFLVPLGAIYAFFVGALLTAPYEGLRSGGSLYLWLSGLAAALSAYAAFVTVLRAPRATGSDAEALVVRERTGRVRRFPRGPGLVVRVVKRYAQGPLADQPTELVEVSGPKGGSRAYLVDAGSLPETPRAGSGGRSLFEQVL